jgi:hypothetical protein
MDELLASDEGLPRRFRSRIRFSDLNVNQATSMFTDMMKKRDMYLEESRNVNALFTDLIARENWSNLADVAFIAQELDNTIATHFYERKKMAQSNVSARLLFIRNKL